MNLYLAADIIAMTICAVISVADGWNEVQLFALNRQNRSFL